MNYQVNNFLKKEPRLAGLRASSIFQLLFSFILLLSFSSFMAIFNWIKIEYTLFTSMGGCLLLYVWLRYIDKKYPPNHIDRLLVFRFFQPKKIKP
jgi:small neutral amino acid transporter SnatA (MarC family)